jgi:hypothetical protein
LTSRPDWGFSSVSLDRRGRNLFETRIDHVVRHHDENQNDHDDDHYGGRLILALDLPQPSPGG